METRRHGWLTVAELTQVDDVDVAFVEDLLQLDAADRFGSRPAGSVEQLKHTSSTSNRSMLGRCETWRCRLRSPI